MDWACLEDRTVLSAANGALICSTCSRRYDTFGAVPLFARDDRDRAEIERRAPRAEELWQSMQVQPAAQAAAAFCERHDDVHSPYCPDRKYFFPVPGGGNALEIGAGFGDDSVLLAGSDGLTISIVPNLTNARIVGRRLQERNGTDWPIAVMRDVSRLPLADSSVQIVAMEEASAASFDLTAANLPTVAMEWSRVLAPGGAVLLGLASSVLRLPATRGRPETLNRWIKRSPASGRGRLGVGRTIRTMARAGFGPPVFHAPLPDENDARVVVPVNDAEVMRYFLSHLIRRNSRKNRLAIAAARGLIALGLLRHFVPYSYLVFRKSA